jgi:hypothetical protein
MNQTEIEAAAMKLYAKHPRRRYITLNENARRFLGNLLRGCMQVGNGEQLFGEALAKLSAHVPGLLRPPPTEPRKFPEPLKDPVTGAIVPSPFGVEREILDRLQQGNISARDRRAAEMQLEAVRAEQAALQRTHPDLFEHYRRSAEGPYAYMEELKREEDERLAAAAREIAYFSDGERNQRENPWATGDAKKQNEIAKNCDKAMTAIWVREARPLETTVSETARGKIFREDKTLSKVLDIMDEEAKRIAAAELEIEQQRQREALEITRRAEAALRDAKHNVTRHADGRIITHAA